MRKQIILLIVLVAAVSSALKAGPVESPREVVDPAPLAENPWSFSLTPYGWMTSVNGTIAVGDRTADVDIRVKEVLKHLDMMFMMAAELRYKRWGLSGDLIYARLHDDFAPPRGLLYSSTHEVVKETFGTLLLSYRAVDLKQKAFLDVLAGARLYSVYSQIVLRPNLAQQGVNVSTTETWADPIIGLRARYYVSQPVSLNFHGDIGGGSEFRRRAGAI